MPITGRGAAAAPLLLYAKLGLVAMIWGGHFIAGRIVAPLLPHYTAGALRFLAASALLVVLVVPREGGLPRLDMRQAAAMVLLAATGVLGFNVLFFAGLDTVPASRGALIMALNPVGIALGTWLFYGERMSALRWLGVALSLLGAAVVIARGDLAALAGGAIGRGDVLLAGAVCCWVAYTLIGRRVLGSMSALAATTYAALIGTAMLLAVAAFESPWTAIDALPWEGWAALLYLGALGTAVAFLWYYEGVQAIGASRAAVFINLVPVFGVLFGATILHEPILGSMIAGGALVILGVTLTNRRVVNP